jgi:hypothetical protein
VQNAPSIKPSDSFLVTTYYTDEIDGIVSQGTISGVTATIDQIDASKVIVTPSSYNVSDTSVTYTISFVIGNEIPEGGYI